MRRWMRIEGPPAPSVFALGGPYSLGLVRGRLQGHRSEPRGQQFSIRPVFSRCPRPSPPEMTARRVPAAMAVVALLEAGAD